MAAILTRETLAEAIIANATADGVQAITLNVSRGNVAIINRVILQAQLRAVASTGTSDGAVGLSLDSGQSAATDLSQLANSEDDDVENEATILDRMYYSFAANADTTNGVGAASAGRATKIIDYSRLPMLDRPITSEDPELLLRTTNGVNGINVILSLYYQVVQLTQQELGNLAPAILGPSARVVKFHSPPQNGGPNAVVVTET